MGEIDPTPAFVITTDRLSLPHIYNLVDAPDHGAVVVMSGMVRNHTKGKAVSHLDYEAYESMALSIFTTISNECQKLYPIGGLAIHHRIGRLYVGEISILVAVGASHRQAAFSACQYTIDRVKTEAPIWKHEYWVEGGSDWVMPQEMG